MNKQPSTRTTTLYLERAYRDGVGWASAEQRRRLDKAIIVAELRDRRAVTS